jgi:hypothetical protein
MDPDANLIEQRRITNRMRERLDADDANYIANELPRDAGRLVDLAIALDEWIVGGGFLPASWRKAQVQA